MQTDYLFLAHAARPNADGLVDAEGMGVSEFVVSGFPVELQVAMVLKLRLAPGEQITHCRLSVALADPHGRAGQVPLGALDIGRNNPGTLRPDGQPSLLVVEVAPQVGAPGWYQLVVQEEGFPIGAVPFRVVQQRW